MKRNIIIVCALALVALVVLADQAMWIHVGKVKTAFTTSQLEEIPISNSSSFTVLGAEYAIANIDSITVDDNAIADNNVFVSFDGNEASVKIAGNIAQYITATVNGAHVTFVQGDVPAEVEYTLDGSSDDGEFRLDGEYKATINLNGLTLTNPQGPALNIKNGKRIDVSVKKGTTNTLTDGAGGDWKGALYCKGHLEFKGKGVLNVYGNTAHGIWSKEYVEMKNCTINVLKAVKDGINCNQYFLMESGSLNISDVGDDGIQVSFKTDDDDNIEVDEENTGLLTVTGGTLNVTTSALGSKGLKSEGGMLFSEDTETTSITIANSGGVLVEDITDDEGKAAKDSTSSACIKSDAIININGGTFNLTNTGEGGRAMLTDTDINFNGGTFTARAEGTNYGEDSSGGGGGGNWWAPPGGGGRPGEESSDTKNAKCVKAKGNIVVNDGNINVYSAHHEAFESKGTMTINGGVIYAEAADDAINAITELTINGGYIYAYSSTNDGIDSNGNIYIYGGVAIAFGGSGAETGVDIDEQHYFYINGGYLFGIGGRIDSGRGIRGTQTYKTASRLSGSGYFIIKNGTTNVFAAKAPKSYSGTAIYSCPEMASGGSYSVSSSSSVSGGTETNGFVKF